MKTNTKKDFKEVERALKIADKYHLQNEVMATAMYYLRAYPNRDIKDAIDNAIDVWITPLKEAVEE